MAAQEEANYTLHEFRDINENAPRGAFSNATDGISPSINTLLNFSRLSPFASLVSVSASHNLISSYCPDETAGVAGVAGASVASPGFST